MSNRRFRSSYLKSRKRRERSLHLESFEARRVLAAPSAPEILSFGPDTGYIDDDGVTSNTAPVLVWESTDEDGDLSGYWWSLNDNSPEFDGTFTTSNSLAPLLADQDTYHTLYVRAVDATGDLSPTTAFHFRLDGSEPLVTGSSPRDEALVQRGPDRIYVNFDERMERIAPGNLTPQMLSISGPGVELVTVTNSFWEDANTAVFELDGTWHEDGGLVNWSFNPQANFPSDESGRTFLGQTGSFTINNATGVSVEMIGNIPGNFERGAGPDGQNLVQIAPSTPFTVDLFIQATPSADLFGWQLQFERSDDALVLNNFVNGPDWAVSFETLDTSLDLTTYSGGTFSGVEVEGEPNLIGTFDVSPPSMPGDYLISLEEFDDTNIAFITHFTEILGSVVMYDYGDLIVRVADDFVRPRGDVVNVRPDPRSTDAGLIPILFTEVVEGVDLSDFTLTRDGTPISLSGLTLDGGGDLYWLDVSTLTGVPGVYELTLNTVGSGIVDLAGNAIDLANPVSDIWELDVSPPTVDIIDVAPDPRNSGPGDVIIGFSEAVLGFELSDLTLTFNGNPVDISGAPVVANEDGTYAVNLDAFASTEGTYVLSLDTTGIEDLVGNAIIADPIVSDTWSVDTTPPTFDIEDVVPNPRDSAVGELDVSFSELIFGLDLGDFTLTMDGNPVDVTAIPFSGDGTTFTIDLTSVTAISGEYVLTLDAATAGIFDVGGNTLQPGDAVTWSFDTTPPTVDIVDVTPDPRNTDAGTVTIVFSEPVTGFTIDDLDLTLDGSDQFLSGALTQVDPQTYTINLASLTVNAGEYVLTLDAATANIADLFGNVMSEGASDAWTTDNTSPTALLEEVVPDPRSAMVDSIAVTFDEVVTGLSVGDFALTLDGAPVDLSSAVLSGADDTYSLDLTSLPLAEGTYELTLVSAGSGVADLANNALVADATSEWSVDATPPTVMIQEVVPDPTNSVIDTLAVTFSEDVTGLTLSDFVLTLDGTGVSLTGASLQGSGSSYSIDLANVSTAGTYSLTLVAANDIVDAAGNGLAGDANETWTLDTTAPTVDIIDVTPDPRAVAAGVVQIDFTEPVTGVDLSDFVLLLDGGNVSLAGLTVLGGGDSYSIDLSSVTTTSGEYQLTLAASGSGILDLAGNALATDGVDNWLMDAVAPTVDIVDVTPDPRSTSAGVVSVEFSEPVTGLTLSDFELTIDGSPASLATAVLAGTDSSYTLDLSGIAVADGAYALSILPAATIVDIAGNALTVGASDDWIQDSVAPAVDIVDVTPDPRNLAVVSVAIDFTESVTGLDVADFALTRDGQAIDISSAALSGSDDSYSLNLTFFTLQAGDYELVLNSAGAGIADAAGNLLATGASDQWTIDFTAPTVDIVDVLPDPRSTGVGVVTVVFNEAVSGVDVSDFALEVDGFAVDLSAAPFTGGPTEFQLDLTAFAMSEGDYELALVASGSGITDSAGNALTISAGDAWTIDASPPTADIIDVTPDPRTTDVTSIEVVFEETVTGVDGSDFELTLDGVPVDTSGLAVSGTGANYTLDLSAVPAGSGLFEITLVAAGSGISDSAGNLLVADATDSWTVDGQPPTVQIDEVLPNPRMTPVGELAIQFSEAVTGFDINDLSLTLDGAPVDISGLVLSGVDAEYSIDLTGVSSIAGDYVLTVAADGSGIIDNAANELASDDSSAWTLDLTAPTVDIVDITPDPRGSDVGIVNIQFSEAVSGFDVSDLALSLYGAPVDISALSVQGAGSDYTIDLSTVTGADGAYVLQLGDTGHSITDGVGNLLLVGATDEWINDGTSPIADIVDVAPDPRTTDAGLVTINFTEVVTGFDLTDLSLTLDGNPVDISGVAFAGSGASYTVDLSSVSSQQGGYELTLSAAGSGVEDSVGNSLTESTSDAWIVDTAAPTISFDSISPDPRNNAVGVVDVTFSEAVIGFDLSDVELTLDGVPVDLSGLMLVGSGADYSLDLSSVTNLAGAYTLSIATDAGHGITDSIGNPLANSASDSWTFDGGSPVAQILEVTPDPRNTPVGLVTIQFSEDVTGFDVTDLVLTLEGGNVDLVGVPFAGSGAAYTVDLSSVTTSNGNYTLTLVDPATSGIEDDAGNGLAAVPSEMWLVDTRAPTVDIGEVSPDPTNVAVASLPINFSEPVTGFELADLLLTLNGGPVDMAAAELTGSGTNYTLQFATATAADGTYLLSFGDLGAAEIVDVAGNALQFGDTEEWSQDTTNPTVDIIDVTPDPRSDSAGTVAIEFSEPVSGFQISDVSLTLDGVPVDLSTVILSGAGADYLIDLTNVTVDEGTYVLTVSTSGSIIDELGNPLVVSGSDTWVVDSSPPTIELGAISPDPRNFAVNSVTVTLSEPMTGLGVEDFALTLDGQPVDVSSVSLGGSGLDLTLNVTGLTSAEGDYELTLAAAGSGIVDQSGNMLASDASTSWTMDTTAPVADIVDIAPDPRNLGVLNAQINFSEDVTGVDIGDFSLTRDGQPVDISSLAVDGNGSSYSIFLALQTLVGGEYVLTLDATGAGIADNAGNALTADATDTWLMDVTQPTVDVVEVTPDPRSTNVGLVMIVFSEPIIGLEASDFAMEVDGIEVDISAAPFAGDGTTFTLDLTNFTNAEGDYEFSLLNNAGVTDVAGNALVGLAGDAWTVDMSGPIADIIDVDPDPTSTPVTQLAIEFDEAVTGLDVSDFSLTLDGNPIDLSGQNLTGIGSSYTLAVGGLTTALGEYQLTLNAAGSGVVDSAGNSLLTSAIEQWTMTEATGDMPTVLDVVVNGDQVDPQSLPGGAQPTDWRTQQSDIISIVIEFNVPVQVTADDIVLTNLGQDAPSDVDFVVAIENDQIGFDGSRVILSFTGPDLVTGVYELELLDSIVSSVGGIGLDGDGDGQSGGSFLIVGTEENGLYELAGDFNGDGFVSVFDFPTFSYWFGQTTDVAPLYVDLNSDGALSIFDFPTFGQNFGGGVVFPVARPSFEVVEEAGSRQELVAGEEATTESERHLNDVALDELLIEWSRPGTVAGEQF